MSYLLYSRKATGSSKSEHLKQIFYRNFPLRCIRWFLLSWFVFVLSGCASVFDAPYEEIETEGPEAVSDPHPLVEVTPGDLHEMIGLPETGKVHYLSLIHI